jgi:ABC-2 type transport system ATP-binding protein
MTISATDAAPHDASIRADDDAAISAVNVSKRYGPVSALEGLTLDIRAGEVFGLLGPNGSGKTTFMRLLAGYHLPSAGHLRVAGHDVIRDSIAVRRRIGYVPEAAPLYRQMRVGEFLAFMAKALSSASSIDSRSPRSSTSRRGPCHGAIGSGPRSPKR